MATVVAPVSMSQLIAVFAGGTSFASYVRGGSYVPNTSTNAAISTTSAGLAMSQFVGASNVVVTGSANPSTLAASSNAAVGRLVIQTGGTTATANGATGAVTYSWAIVYAGGSSGSGTCTVNTPSGATTTFNVQTPTEANQAASGADKYTATCTMQDAGTGQSTTTVVPVSATNSRTGP